MTYAAGDYVWAAPSEGMREVYKVCLFPKVILEINSEYEKLPFVLDSSGERLALQPQAIYDLSGIFSGKPRNDMFVPFLQQHLKQTSKVPKKNY